ncbi:tyrosine-type recombinase/integrase [Paraburkholderia rhynchosiae]|uniref:Integrase n=1 Tax=Paraburkholderia rhynchosiae TaxID=487049 RepID=A0A2N7WHV7_9BURK|nr:integrase arm-type DNA-binding domain-containing protein [Paraburkholderia rhynchosiae]PMS29008.1 integrase [Paraburkholderia rhynchosiae]CAB3668096.1 Prophage integrase IntS [Paraburkholderia rhynchosiae]
MPLTVREVEAARPRPKPYGIADGDGLVLWVTPEGSKFWHFRYRLHGKQPRISLGRFPDVTLQKARQQAATYRTLVADGADPRAKRRIERQRADTSDDGTFRVAAELWYKSKQDAGRSASTLDKIRTYLDKDILVELGSIKLVNITRADCARVQARFEKRDALNVSKKARGWLREIFSQAIARGQCEFNPASELKVIAKPARKARPYPHLLEPELPDFLRALEKSTSRLIAYVAAWMTIWTASRPGMVRYAEWTEVDLDGALWTISAEKMKMRRSHVTPLPSQLVNALGELKKLTGRHQYVFPGIGTKHEVISENTINLVFSKIGYKGRMVGHGIRHTASTLLREHGWVKDHVETQLAHLEEGIAGDYNHARYLAQRRAMVQWYADYLDALKADMHPAKQQSFAQRVNRIPVQSTSTPSQTLDNDEIAA